MNFICVPLFYFHTEDGGRYEDREGVQLPDLDAAKTEAAKMAGQMLQDRPDHLWDSHGWRMTVTDANSQPLFVIRATATPASPDIHEVKDR